MKRAAPVIILIALVAVLAAAGVVYLRQLEDGVDASDLFARTLAAQESLTYIAETTTTTRYAGRRITTRATVYRRGASERIEYPDASQQGAWAITRGRTTFTCLPGQDLLLENTADSLLTSPQRTALLQANYRARMEGSDLVAGRMARVLRITPRKAPGPSRKIWVDAERLVVLRSIDYSASGQARTEMEVLSIDCDARIDAARFAAPANAAGQRIAVTTPSRPHRLGNALRIQVGKPSYLPRGYSLDGCYLFNCQCGCGHRAAQLTYTDGLGMISIFQVHGDVSCSSGSCGENGQGCIIQDSEVARLGQVERGGKSVVVVADLPPEEIRRVAESVR